MKTIMKLINRALVAALVISTMSLNVQAKRYFEQTELLDINIPVVQGKAMTEISQKDAEVASNAIGNIPGSDQLTAKEKATIWEKLWKLVKEHKVAVGAIGTIAAILTAILIAEKASGGAVSGFASEKAKKAKGSLVRQLLGSEQPSKPYGKVEITPFTYTEEELSRGRAEEYFPSETEASYEDEVAKYYAEKSKQEAFEKGAQEFAFPEYEFESGRTPQERLEIRYDQLEKQKAAAEQQATGEKSLWQKLFGK